MRYLANLSIIICFLAVFSSCFTTVYTNEQMEIKPEFVELFSAISKNDTSVFECNGFSNKIFLFYRLDSSTLNKKGPFINGGPFKTVRIKIREIGSDTSRLARENEISISKSPLAGKSSLVIKLNNFYFSDTTLQSQSDSTISFNNQLFSIKKINSMLPSRNDNDIRELWVGSGIGIYAYKTLSGHFWTRLK